MFLSRLVHDVVDFMYPGVCGACGKACSPGGFACSGCLLQLRWLESAAACDRCAMPIAEPAAPCPFCKGAGVANYRRILRLGTFDDPLKRLIHQLKYHGRWGLGEQLAERLLNQERIRAVLHDFDVLVPVPLHAFRQFTRGYNQAAVIARRLSKEMARPLARPLRRIRNTETQTHLHSREKRLENLRGAFRLIHPAQVRGKHVLVIDDVTTTGATLQTVARALRPARPASLSALVLAVADPRGRDFEAV